MRSATILLFALLLSTTPVMAQGGATALSFAEAVGQRPVIDARPTKRQRADVALGIVSLSASSVALGITAACIRDASCQEVNPIFRQWLGKNQTNAIIGKAVIGGVTHYLVWRLMKPGKFRTAMLGLVAGVNVFDAVHDVRTLRTIDRGR